MPSRRRVASHAAGPARSPRRRGLRPRSAPSWPRRPPTGDARATLPAGAPGRHPRRRRPCRCIGSRRRCSPPSRSSSPRAAGERRSLPQARRGRCPARVVSTEHLGDFSDYFLGKRIVLGDQVRHVSTSQFEESAKAPWTRTTVARIKLSCCVWRCPAQPRRARSYAASPRTPERGVYGRKSPRRAEEGVPEISSPPC